MPGKPKPSSKWRPASEITDFQTLYSENCLGCHSAGQTIAGSLPMNAPVYLSVIPEETLRDVIRSGIPGHMMPAFSETIGGPLTDQQVDILVSGIMAWKPAAPPAGPLPPYAAPLGDVAAGRETFGVACASCHGADGKGGPAGSVVNPAYLGLVSDQYLRSIVIGGRRDMGCPDFTARIPGRVMSDAEIANVTAWLVSNRRNEFGEPIVPQP